MKGQWSRQMWMVVRIQTGYRLSFPSGRLTDGSGNGNADSTVAAVIMRDSCHFGDGHFRTRALSGTVGAGCRCYVSCERQSALMRVLFRVGVISN